MSKLSDNASMHRTWFIWENGKVDGPFSMEVIEQGINQKRWPESALIWFRGQKQWVTLGSWAPHLPTIKLRLAQEKEAQWYCRLAGQTVGPLPFDEMARLLEAHHDSKNARLWSQTLKTWTPIYQIAEFSERLNFRLRLFARAPITGDVEIHAAECTHQGRLESVSEGGVHITSTFRHDDPNRAIHLTVKSLALPQTLRATGRSLYFTPTGFGLRFGHLSQDDRKMLKAYILQYQESPELQPNLMKIDTPPQDAWFLHRDSKMTGPFSVLELIEKLRSTDDLSEVLIRSNQEGAWIQPFENPIIANTLGVERRKSNRIPIVGLLCFSNKNTQRSLETLTLSQNGISVANGQDLAVGQILDTVLKVDRLGGPIRARVVVKYKSPRGDVGLGFENIQSTDLERITTAITKEAS